MPTQIDTRPSGRTIAGKKALATALSSQELKSRWDEKIKEQALFSARTTSETYLDMVRKNLSAIASGQLTPQAAEKNLRQTLQNLGYSPETGFAGAGGRVPPAKPSSIQDLSSSQRIRLIIDTNVKQARSLGQIAVSETPSMMMTYPAWKLTRTGARKKPRGDWIKRWQAAGNSVGWYGASKKQLVALKTSPIWKALGEGAGGYRDTIGASYPPFAFGSGMAWVNVDWDDWEELCEREGIPDRLDEITAKARAMKRAGASNEPTETNVPTMSPSLVTMPKVETQYRANTVKKQMAERAVYGATDRMREMTDELQKAADNMAKQLEACQDFAEKNPLLSELADRETGKFTKYAEAIADAMTEVGSLMQRVANYGSAVQTMPLPTNDAQQRAYDAAMERTVQATGKTLRMAQTAFEAAMLRRKAADKTTEKVKSLKLG